MLEAEEQLDQALRVGGTQQRARRSRMRCIYSVAASYGTDALFLALFAAAGTISWRISVAYGAAATPCCAPSPTPCTTPCA